MQAIKIFSLLWQGQREKILALVHTEKLVFKVEYCVVVFVAKHTHTHTRARAHTLAHTPTHVHTAHTEVVVTPLVTIYKCARL